MKNENKPSQKSNDRVNENDTKHAAHIPERASDKIYNAIVRIEKGNLIGTGFFMKLNIKGNIIHFLITCYHNINEQDVESKITIDIFYGKSYEEKKMSIKLDDKERFITYFKGDKDVTVIEVLKKDQIPEDKYLIPDSSYKYGFNSYKTEKFMLAGYPNDIIYQKERHIASGEITDIDDFDFEHTIDTRNGSSGAPICLISNVQVVGIHKQGHKTKPINYGTFLGIIIDDLEKNYKKISKENNEILYLKQPKMKIQENKEINELNKENKMFILLDNFSNKNNIELQKRLVYFINNQNQNNYNNAFSDLKNYIQNNHINIIGGRDLFEFFTALKIYSNVDSNYQQIIRDYTGNVMYRYINNILIGGDNLLLHKFIYFIAGFIKSLNITTNIQVNYNCTLYRGMKIDFDDLIFYKKSINQIICFKSFLSTIPSKKFAESVSSGVIGNKYGTIMIINYKYNPQCLYDLFDITKLSMYSFEKEILFKSFSFFRVVEVKINEKDKKAEITLNHIGKAKNFDSRLDLLSQGSSIQYNQNKDMIEII